MSMCVYVHHICDLLPFLVSQLSFCVKNYSLFVLNVVLRYCIEERFFHQCLIFLYWKPVRPFTTFAIHYNKL